MHANFFKGIFDNIILDNIIPLIVDSLIFCGGGMLVFLLLLFTLFV
jgi:hypothetical protein